MGSSADSVYFYIYALILVISAAGVVFSPRMFYAFCAFFFTLLFSSFIYALLNATFMAVFQFILCGLVLCLILLLVLKKITIWNLPLKIATTTRTVATSLIMFLFGIITYLYVNFEFNGVISDFFDFIKEKSIDVVDFSNFMFSIHLAIILTIVLCVMVRNIYLTKNSQEDKND